MKFGPVPVGEAEGAVLAHSQRLPGRMLKKGHTLTAGDIAAFAAAGIADVTALRLDADDVGEDQAAGEIAAALTGAHVRLGTAFTGRANLFSEIHGLITYDRARLDTLNLIDEAVTVATLPVYETVIPGQMIATIKIIPFAVSRSVVDKAIAVARDSNKLMSIAPFRHKRIGLVLTRLPGMKESILDKTVTITRNRVEPLGSEIVHVERCGHDESEVTAAIQRIRAQDCDIILLFGASAVVDRNDVLPAALVDAGGHIYHFGMPVDPGNLLFLGALDEMPVLGMPGCARSPKLNGFDWVLWRLLADVPVTRRDIMLMGVGGLLVEIPQRGQPRLPKATKAKSQSSGPRIAALILAAGASTRMGANKLTADLGGIPLVARTAAAVAKAQISSITVVTGHQADIVKAALSDIEATFVHNPSFAEGLSTSLRTGITALPKDIDGVIVCLGDMPLIAPKDIDRLIGAFNPLEGRAICVPVHEGRRGNPVLWGKSFFAEMTKLSGDSGARRLFEEHADQIVEIVVADDSVLFDVDTPDKLAEVRTRHLA